MKHLTIVLSAMLMLSAINAKPAGALQYCNASVAMISENGTAARSEFTLAKEPSGDAKFFADAPSRETIVWESEKDDTKAMDVDKVYISHDPQYINVRMLTFKNLNEIEGDAFISVAIDTDLNPSTGMPKAKQNSYNMGGEDFFARFSTAYGEQKFVIDRWDQQSGDTVETGGMANASASGKEIEFSIPRLAIGDPCRLDFKVVARTYQSVDPDLSADHLSYDLAGTDTLKGWSVEKTGNKTISVTAPAMPSTGVAHAFLAWDNIIMPITRYSCEAPKNPDAVIWSKPPQVGKHLFITRIESLEDDENLKFTFRFENSLKGMGNCDLKVWAMLDTDGKPNVGFEGVKFEDNYSDYILEVCTESGSVKSKFYQASKGMGYNQPSLNTGTLDFDKGICEMVIKKSRLGEFTKIKAKFACGGFKAVDADWDSTQRIELPGKLMYLQYEVPYVENPRGFPVEVTKVECVMDTAYLYMRLSVKNLEKGSLTVWIDQDMNLATGWPKSPVNPPGIDNAIELSSTMGAVWQCMPDLSKKKIGDFLGIRYNDGRLAFPVPLKLLSNPKAVRFHVVSQAEKGTESYTLWFLTCNTTDDINCSDALKLEASSFSGSAKIKWTTSLKNPLGFYVYRRGDGDTFERITNIPVFENEYIDEKAELGKYYQYRIRSICEEGAVSEMSEISGVLVKTDRPTAKIQIDKTLIDLGQRYTTRNLCDGFTVKNLGPGSVDFWITTSDPKLSATSDSLHIEEGQSKRVNVCITANLPVGKWEQSVSIDTGEIKVIIPVRVEVVPSSAGDKSIDNLSLKSLVEGLEISWNPPKYNVSNLKNYDVTITESYFEQAKSTKKITVEASATNLKLGSLVFTTVYRISVRPVFENGPGLESVVSGSPLPASVYIIMKVGSVEAIVNGKAAKMPAKAIIDTKTNKVLVPFRFIAESLRCKVEYNSQKKIITMTQGYKTVVLTVGSTKATIDGMKMDCSPAPSIIGGSTYVPVRFVAEAFLAETTWDNAKKQVGIYFPQGYRPTY